MKKIDRVLQRYRYSVVEPFVPDNSDILDIGGFDGSFVLRLRNRINRGVCIDPYIEEKKEGRIEFIRTEVTDRLPFPDESFDIVTMLAVYEHLDELREVVTSEAFRVLRNNGLAILTVPAATVDIIIKFLYKVKIIDGMSADGTLVEDHKNFHPSDTIKIFEGAGFKLKKWSRFQIGLNNLFIFQKIK